MINCKWTVQFFAMLSAVSVLCQTAYPGAEIIPSFTLSVERKDHFVSYTPSNFDFEYILSSSEVELNGMDFIPEINESKGVVEIPWGKEITLMDFPKFAFFDDTPSTIGFLRGYAGNAARTFSLTFIDINTGRTLEIPNISSLGPNWITKDGRPIGWREVRFNYVGWGALSLGYAPRLHKCWLIKGEKGVRAPGLEVKGFQEAFDAVELLEEDWAEFQKPLVEVDRKAAVLLLDYLYYGTMIGEDEKVKAVLEKLGDELREELQDRKWMEYGGFKW